MSAQIQVLRGKGKPRNYLSGRRSANRIQNYAWVLPRPRRGNKYIGCFPEHFEKKLLRLLGRPSIGAVMHPFGGMSEFGLRIDLRRETKPDIIADAHKLPIRSEAMELVVLDPPYSEDLSERLYDTAKIRPLKFSEYTKEAVRVLKESGYLVMYHFMATPRIPNTVLRKRIFLETRVWHRLRCIHIHRKETESWRKNDLDQFIQS